MHDKNIDLELESIIDTYGPKLDECLFCGQPVAYYSGWSELLNGTEEQVYVYGLCGAHKHTDRATIEQVCLERVSTVSVCEVIL